jgi:hypothetical protein
MSEKNGGKKCATMKITSSILCLLLLQLSAAAQKTLSDLPPAHTSALQEFIVRRPSLEFLSEKQMDEESLKGIREHFGAGLMPYYRRGDFNHDGVQDFAMILAREGPLSEQEGVNSPPHRYRYPITVVIFNGQKKGGYKVAFVKDTDAPLVCFLNVTSEKRKRLGFGVFETDEHFIMTPAGKGYLIEYDN